MTQKEKLNQVSSVHSYTGGFNGEFAKYRIRKLNECNNILSGSVLDVGCGEGQILDYLHGKFDKVVAIEPAMKPYNITKNKFPNLEIYNTIFEEFEYDDRFDVVLAMGVLEHVPDPQVFLRQARKYLKGRLVVTVPNGESLHRRIGMKMGLIKSHDELGVLDVRVGHHRYYDFDSLRREIETAGFEVGVMTGIFVKPFPFPEIAKLSEDYREGLYKLSYELPRLCAEIFLIAH